VTNYNQRRLRARATGPHMANVDEPDTYKAFTDCMARGAHVELKLRVAVVSG